MYNKTIKWKKVVETFFDAASIIDNHCVKEAWHWKQLGEHSLGQVMLWQQFLGLLKQMHTSYTKSFTQEAQS